jgi:hypothetical protein
MPEYVDRSEAYKKSGARSEGSRRLDRADVTVSLRRDRRAEAWKKKRSAAADPVGHDVALDGAVEAFARRVTLDTTIDLKLLSERGGCAALVPCLGQIVGAVQSLNVLVAIEAATIVVNMAGDDDEVTLEMLAAVDTLHDVVRSPTSYEQVVELALQALGNIAYCFPDAVRIETVVGCEFKSARVRRQMAFVVMTTAERPWPIDFLMELCAAGDDTVNEDMCTAFWKTPAPLTLVEWVLRMATEDRLDGGCPMGLDALITVVRSEHAYVAVTSGAIEALAVAACDDKRIVAERVAAVVAIGDVLAQGFNVQKRDLAMLVTVAHQDSTPFAFARETIIVLSLLRGDLTLFGDIMPFVNRLLDVGDPSATVATMEVLTELVRGHVVEIDGDLGRRLERVAAGMNSRAAALAEVLLALGDECELIPRDEMEQYNMYL